MQLPLEQHRFELCGPTYMQIFSIVNTTVLHNLRLFESIDAEASIGRVDCQVTHGYSTALRDRPLTPRLFKGQLYISTQKSIREIKILILLISGWQDLGNLSFGHATQHVGSQFSKQGWNLSSLHWKLRVLTPALPGKFLGDFCFLLFTFPQV